MKRFAKFLLALVALLIPCVSVAQNIGYQNNVQVVTFSATPTFNASQAGTFVMTLTGNVTSSTLASPTVGEDVLFILSQDGTGSRTFVWPSNVVGAPTIKSAASSVTTFYCQYDGTNCNSVGNNLGTPTLLGRTVFPASVAAASSFNIPTGVVPTTPAVGDWWVPAQVVPSFAEVSGSTIGVAGTLFSLNAVQAASATGGTVTGSTQSITAGLTNVVGKTVEIEGWGLNTNVTGTPTVALAFKIGATTVATCTSTAVTNTVVAVVHFKLHYVVQATGATGNDIAHCEMSLPLTSATAAASFFVDNNSAVTSNYDHTIANNFSITFTSAGASNTFTLHTLVGNIKN